MVLQLDKSCAAQTKKDLMVRDISPVKRSAGCKSVRHLFTIKFLFQSLPPLPDAHCPPLRMLNCKAHQCQQVCHRGQCQPCPRSPSLVKTCPCSQTPLTKLLELGYSERKSCSDPIPSCGKTCSKPLPCGSNGEKEGLVM